LFNCIDPQPVFLIRKRPERFLCAGIFVVAQGCS
jgi:hypothetical protein